MPEGKYLECDNCGKTEKGKSSTEPRGWIVLNDFRLPTYLNSPNKVFLCSYKCGKEYMENQIQKGGDKPPEEMVKDLF